jgi:hypothetical protein
MASIWSSLLLGRRAPAAGGFLMTEALLSNTIAPAMCTRSHCSIPRCCADPRCDCTQVLRVHAILVTRAPSLVQPRPSPSPSSGTPQQQQQQVSEARAAAVGLLAQVLGGDSLAAEYLLLTALGRVTAR